MTARGWLKRLSTNSSSLEIKLYPVRENCLLLNVIKSKMTGRMFNIR